MSIIITGASGHFGSLTGERLLQKLPADDVIMVTRRPEALAAFAEQGVKVRFGDFDDPASLAEAFQGGTRMLMISTSSVGRRIAQHGTAINTARDAGVGHIVYTSFVGISDDNPAMVVKDHRGTEALLRESGLAWTFMRNSQYAEALAEMAIPNHLPAGRWLATAATGKIALVSREDCVDCAVAVLAGTGHENRVYHVTGPELLSFRDVADMAAAISGRPLAYTVVSEADMYAFYDSLGVPRQASEDPDADPIPWCSDDMVSFEQALENGFFAVLSDDVQELLGRPPRTMRDVLLAHKHLYVA